MVPYQEAPWPPMTEELRAACKRDMYVVTRDGLVLRGARGMLFVLGHLGWRRLAHFLTLPPFIWAVKLGYRVLADNRSLVSRLLLGRRPTGQGSSTSR